MYSGVYLTALLLLIALAILTGSIILYLEIRGGNVPQCLRNLFINVLPKYLPFVKKVGRKSELVTVSDILHHFLKKEKHPFENGLSVEPVSARSKEGRKQTTNDELQDLCKMIRIVLSQWSEIKEMKLKTEVKEEAKADWATYVNVIERLCSAVFILLLIIFVIMLANPHWY